MNILFFSFLDNLILDKIEYFVMFFLALELGIIYLFVQTFYVGCIILSKLTILGTKTLYRSICRHFVLLNYLITLGNYIGFFFSFIILLCMSWIEALIIVLVFYMVKLLLWYWMLVAFTRDFVCWIHWMLNL